MYVHKYYLFKHKSRFTVCSHKNDIIFRMFPHYLQYRACFILFQNPQLLKMKIKSLSCDYIYNYIYIYIYIYI